MSPAEYECHHEELLQNHSLKLTELEKEVQFKKEKLDDLKKDNERMEQKIDHIQKSINEIVNASKEDDTLLDKRLTQIETRLDTQEKIQKNNRDDFNLKLAIITAIFMVLTFYFNFIHHL